MSLYSLQSGKIKKKKKDGDLKYVKNAETLPHSGITGKTLKWNSHSGKVWLQ